jgi:hypothetical protein
VLYNFLGVEEKKVHNLLAAVAEFREKSTISKEHFEAIRQDVRKRGGRK